MSGESTKGAVAPTKLSVTEKKLPKLIVFNIVPERGVDKGLSNLISELVADKISRLGRYTVIGQKDLEKMLTWEENNQLQGRTDIDFLVKLAGEKGASFYVEGSIGNVGDQYLITLKLIDAEKVVVKERVTEKTDRDEKVIVGVIETMVDRIMGLPVGPTPVGSSNSPRAQRAATAPATVSETSPNSDKSLLYRNCGMGFTFSGVGVAAIGGVMTYMASVAASDKRSATDSKGIKDAQSRLDAYNGAAVAMYSIGGAAVATGIVLWVLSATDKKPAGSTTGSGVGSAVGSARAERGPTVRGLAFAPVFAPGFGGMTVGGEW